MLLLHIKIKCIKKTSGIDSDLKKAVEKDLYFKLEEQGELLLIDKPMYLYRIHNDGISRDIFKAEYWYWLVRIRAAERRKISLEEIFESEMLDKIKTGKQQIMNTNDYRIGNLLLTPIRKIYRYIFK